MCEGDTYEARRGVMETRGASFLGWQWANRGKLQLICTTCFHILAFAEP